MITPDGSRAYEEAELSGEIVLDTGSQVVTLVEDTARPGAYLVRFAFVFYANAPAG